MSETQKATFGAGCFWGAEMALRKLDGVLDSRVGYALEAGRDAPLIEVVQVDFAPEAISYASLVDAFWGLHDPTSVDRQGEHVGVKYRSAIFTHTSAQAVIAAAARTRLDSSGRYRRPVTTVVVELGRFELADEDQQRYLERNGLVACAIGAE